MYIICVCCLIWTVWTTCTHCYPTCISHITPCIWNTYCYYTCIYSALYGLSGIHIAMACKYLYMCWTVGVWYHIRDLRSSFLSLTTAALCIHSSPDAHTCTLYMYIPPLPSISYPPHPPPPSPSSLSSCPWSYTAYCMQCYWCVAVRPSEGQTAWGLIAYHTLKMRIPL